MFGKLSKKDFQDTQPMWGNTHAARSEPTIAVLITVYNEEPVIKQTIYSLVSADIPRRDIFIVDDKSTDNTATIAKSIGVNVFTVPKNGGKANAQKQGLSHFQLTERYDWVIFLDGDTKVDLYFYNAMFKVANTAKPTVGLFVGQVKSVPNTHIYSAARAFDYTYSHDVAKEGQSKFDTVYVAPGCTSMYRSSVLKHLEIDHKTLAEDMDLTIQVHRLGYSVKYISNAIVNTQDPSTFGDYHKQTIRWYRGFWQVVKKHGILSFKKKQPVDLYMIMIILDALVLNRVFWTGFILATMPGSLPAIFLLDIGISALIAIYTAFRTKRLDVVYKLPIYYWLSYVNFYAYIRAFVEVVICNKELLAWNKVKRYEFESHINT